MYLLSEDYCSVMSRDFQRVHDKLRDNGCHSPTKDSIIKVFKAVKALAALSRLTSEATDQRIAISTETLIRMLNGTDATLDISGNGIEFTGWYTELYAFVASGLLEHSSRTGLVITRKFIRQFCSDPYEDANTVNDRLFEFFQECQVMDRVRIEIVNRAKRFEIVHLLLAGMYAERIA